MFISRDGLKKLLFSNVVELKFQRKHPTSESVTRRMLCVGSYPYFQSNPFLASNAAQVTLRYRYPKGFPPYPPKPYYNPDDKNLVITWDIFLQDYRSITVNRCNVIRVFPIKTSEEIKEFWNYFGQYIAPMSVQEKINFALK